MAHEARELNWGAFKPRLAEAISAHLQPIQQEYALITEDRAVLDQVLSPIYLFGCSAHMFGPSNCWSELGYMLQSVGPQQSQTRQIVQNVPECILPAGTIEQQSIVSASASPLPASLVARLSAAPFKYVMTDPTAGQASLSRTDVASFKGCVCAQVLLDGAEAANETAARTLFNVRQAMGFTPQPGSNLL